MHTTFPDENIFLILSQEKNTTEAIQPDFFFQFIFFSTMSRRLEFSHGLRKAHEPQALDSYCLRNVFSITMETMETQGVFHYAKLTGQRSVGIPEENGTTYSD